MIEIREMTRADLSQGYRLSQQACWNQRLEDWRNLFGLTNGLSFVAVRGDEVVGTVMALTQGKVGWVAMMLVDASARRQGLGKALMERCLDAGGQRGLEVFGLDATAYGQSLYERLGFEARSRIDRHGGLLIHHGAAEVQPPPGWTVRGTAQSDREHLIRLDHAAHGRDRSAWIDLLLGDPGFEVLSFRDDRDEFQAYIATRPGREALQIGPCVAKIELVGVVALAFACSHHQGGRVWIDIADDQPACAEVADSFSLTVHRSFARMWRGLKSSSPVLSPSSWSGVTGGPDFG